MRPAPGLVLSAEAAVMPPCHAFTTYVARAAARRVRWIVTRNAQRSDHPRLSYPHRVTTASTWPTITSRRSACIAWISWSGTRQCTPARRPARDRHIRRAGPSTSATSGLYTRSTGRIRELVDGQPVVRASIRSIDDGWRRCLDPREGLVRDRSGELRADARPDHMGASRLARPGLPRDPARRRTGPAGVADGPPFARRAMSLRSFSRFLGVIPRARLRKYWHHGLRHDDWNIGVADAPVASFLAGHAMRDVAWAPVRKGRYSADPFSRRDPGALQESTTRTTPTSTGRARSLRRRWSRERGGERADPALDIGSHLSYPFLIETEGRRLLLPENPGNRDLWCCTREIH